MLKLRPGTRTFAWLLFAVFLFQAGVALCGEPAKLIPRLAFFGGADKFNFRVSPDGKSLAYLGPSGKGGLGLWLQTPGAADARLVTSDPKALGAFDWAYDNRHLLLLRDSGQGTENFHLFGVDVQTGETRDLTPFDGVKAQNLLTEPGRPGEALIGLNRRDKRYFDMFRVDLAGGRLEPECENPGDVRWWLADAALEVRAAVALNQQDASTVLRTRARRDAPWKDVITWPFGETGFVEGYGSEIAVAFTADGRGLYIQAPFGGDIPRLARVDAGTGKLEEIVASDDQAGLWGVMDRTLYDKVQLLLDPKTRRVQAAGFCDLVPEWKVYAPELEPDFAVLRKAHSGVFRIVSRDAADAMWVVNYIDDDGPNAEVLYDRTKKTTTVLSEARPVPEGFALAAMKPVVITARDGLRLPSYLTVPVGVEPKSLPLVLLVHGGPWARDDWGFSFEAQWLANRGYAVLQVNFRGSAGFGKTLLNAGNGQWGAKMHDDLADAVAWAVGEGLADPARVGIVGGSYGGYAALAGACFQPDIFACAVAQCGISNVRSFMKTMPDWWAPIRVRWLRRIGPALDDDAFNERISPLFHTDRVKAKVLVFHGANDPRVNIAESDQIVARMRDKSVDVTYIVCPDEGHGFRRGPNVLDMLGRTEEFLAKTLGGRAEPWRATPGCTAQVR